MADNTLPNSLKKLFALCEDMCDGLHDHEVAVGVLHCTEAVVRPALTATKAAELQFQGGRVAVRDATGAVRAADAAGRTLLKDCRRVFASLFGEDFSLDWEAGGWPNNKAAVPTNQDERFTLLGQLKDYFTAHPTRENAPMGVTAANIDAKFQAISDARDDRDDADTQGGIKKNTRDGAVANLRAKMGGLIEELGRLLADDDPMWHSFGLSRPADPETPDVPEGLAVLNGPAHSLLATWERALRAARYRVFKQVVGVDAEFVHVITVEDEDATLPGFSAGQTVNVRVTAANDAGESLPSVVVQIVVT